MFGIDVSEFQGSINWARVKPNIDFAVLRLGWIGKPGSHKLDAQFDRNYQECTHLGIPVGVYVYCYSTETNAAESGAKWTLQVLNGKRLALPVIIDMEEPKLISQGRDALTRITISFNEAIRQGGHVPGVYASLSWYTHQLDKERLRSKYFTWIAAYSAGATRFQGEHDMWQNSDKGRIDGISTFVDTDYLYTGFPVKDTQSDMQTLTIEHITAQHIYIVQPGDTLSSIAVRFNTSEAALAAKNGISAPNLLQPGRKLIL